MRFHRAERQVFRETLGHPERQRLAAARSAAGAAELVELKRMDDLVAEHVIGVGQRRRKRQRNPAPSGFGHARGAAVDQPGTIRV